jgi:cation:H+ antiporter
MLTQIALFVVAMIAVIHGATTATRHAALLAESYRLSKYLVGFIVVAVISILPETLISLSAAYEGKPEFGLGTLFGSNIADLTIVFAILVFAANRRLRVETKILKHNAVYPFVLFLPLILGIDGFFSRADGLALIIVGVIFYLLALKSGIDNSLPIQPGVRRWAHAWRLVGSMAMLLVGSHFVVTSASEIATAIGISPILIGMLVVGLGTTMPELLFSLKSVRKRDDSLAIGDILGTVLADATVVVGILAIVSPFAFPLRIMYITGAFMVLAAFVLFWCMHTNRAITKKEAFLLLGLWLAFVHIEFLASQ